MFGDFNLLIGSQDKCGGNPPDLGLISDLYDVLVDFSLSDLDFIGKRFTWTNRRPILHTVEERLDFFLANDLWHDQWPFCTVSHLLRYKSDHCPILLNAFTVRRKKKKRQRVFRFEEVWLQKQEDCAEIVQNIRSRDGADFVQKTGNLSSALLTWGDEAFGHLPRQIAVCKEELKRLDNGPKRR